MALHADLASAERLESEGRGDHDAGESVPSAGELERGRAFRLRQASEAVIRVEEGEVGHARVEGAVPERVLAVDAGGDAAADRDGRIPGLHREPEAGARGHREELAEGHSRLDLDGAPSRIEGEDAVEPLHLNGHRSSAEAR